MDPKALADIASKAMAAVKDQDGDTALKLLEQLLVALAGGAPADDSASSTPDGATAESGDPQPAPAAAANSAEVGAALAKLLGVNTEAEAVTLFRSLNTTVDGLRAERNSADLGARRDLIATLVKLGVETPATAWEGDAVKRQPCKRLMVETLDEMRARVEAFSRMPRRLEVAPPLGGAGGGDGSKEFQTQHGVIVLSASEIKSCEEAGAKLEAYAQNKAAREAARAGRAR